MDHSDKLKKIDKSLRRLDKVIENMHADFGLDDRFIDPVLILLAKARQCLENIKIKLEIMPK